MHLLKVLKIIVVNIKVKYFYELIFTNLLLYEKHIKYLIKYYKDN